jgi:hypothetical protein
MPSSRRPMLCSRWTTNPVVDLGAAARDSERDSAGEDDIPVDQDAVRHRELTPHTNGYSQPLVNGKSPQHQSRRQKSWFSPSCLPFGQ